MTLAAQAQALRRKGLTYREIAAALGIDHGIAWRLCNREAYNAICRESSARYAARGRIALCDMPETAATSESLP